MRSVLAAIVCMAACGRSGFDELPDARDPTGDGGLPPSAFTQLPLPAGGLASDIAVAPTSPSIVYVTVGGHVSRSTDRGLTWSDCAVPGGYRWLVAVDPANADVVYVGGELGVDRSTDACATWTPFSSRGVDSLETAGADVLIGSGGLFRWRQGTWSALPSAADGHSISGIEVATDGTIFVSTWDMGVLRSTNDGASFNAVNSGLTDLVVNGFTLVDPGTPATLLAETNLGAFVSTDGGTSWSTSGAGADGRDGLASDPDDRSFVVANSWHGMLRSYAGGVTFDGSNPRSAVLANAWSNRFAFEPGSGGRVHVATNRGVFTADDHNLLWYSSNGGLNAHVIEQVADVPGTQTVFATTTGGLARSDDDGASWTIESTGMDIGDSQLHAVHVASSGLVLAGGTSWLWSSSNAGRTFNVALTISQADGWAITAASSAWPRVWVGTGTRLQHTDDGGGQWYTNALPNGDHWVTDIVGADVDIWVATDAGVFHTIDDGSTFQLVSNPMFTGAWCLARATDGTMLTCTDDGIYALPSGSSTWTQRGLAGQYAHDLIVDGTRWIAATENGVFVTTDNGATWNELPGLAGRRPDALLLRANGDLFVGTYGYGLYRMRL